MAVGDVKAFHVGERRFQRFADRRVVNDPNGVADAVVGHKIIDRGVALLPGGNGGLDGGAFAISEKDRPGVCVAVVYMVHAVLFFVGAGELVLFDHAVQIIVDAGAADKTGLAAAVHDLAVDIKAGGRVLGAHAALLQRVKVFARLAVNGLVIGVDVGRKVDLGLVHMQKRKRFSRCGQTRFGAVHHVIGQRGNVCGAFAHGTHGAKRSKNSHGQTPLSERICIFIVISGPPFVNRRTRA